jgi:dihydrodiol dehydrogenase / D-xylose 1-dehydrogenase (NADP)
MEKVRNLINEGILGEIMMITADFGFKHSGKQRLTDPNLSGGALLDIGIYTIALSTMVYHELPSKIQALGKIGETGVDELVSIQLNYSNNKMASLICSIITPMNKEAMIYGTKGRIKIHAPFWCPTNITLFTEENKEEKKFEFSLPETNQHFNFINSIGLIYQIQYIQKKLFNKEIESDLMTVNESLINIKIMDEVRKQIGLKYPFEK